MKKLEEAKQKLMASGKASELSRLAGSPEAARIKNALDVTALKNAAASGDGETLAALVTQVLTTPEGQALAKKVGETFGGK